MGNPVGFVAPMIPLVEETQSAGAADCPFNVTDSGLDLQRGSVLEPRAPQGDAADDELYRQAADTSLNLPAGLGFLDHSELAEMSAVNWAAHDALAYLEMAELEYFEAQKIREAARQA